MDFEASGLSHPPSGAHGLDTDRFLLRLKRDGEFEMPQLGYKGSWRQSGDEIVLRPHLKDPGFEILNNDRASPDDVIGEATLEIDDAKGQLLWRPKNVYKRSHRPFVFVRG